MPQVRLATLTSTFLPQFKAPCQSGPQRKFLKFQASLSIQCRGSTWLNHLQTSSKWYGRSTFSILQYPLVELIHKSWFLAVSWDVARKFDHHFGRCLYTWCYCRSGMGTRSLAPRSGVDLQIGVFMLLFIFFRDLFLFFLSGGFMMFFDMFSGVLNVVIKHISHTCMTQGHRGRWLNFWWSRKRWEFCLIIAEVAANGALTIKYDDGPDI